MAAGKWIGGILSFMTGGPIGALEGLALGAMFDVFSSVGKGGQYADDNGGYSAQQQMYEGQRNSFLFSLLVLASYIIKADGKVMHSEMEVVRRFLRNSFGENAVAQGEQILLKLFEEQNRANSYDP